MSHLAISFRHTCFHAVSVFGHVEDGASRVHQQSVVASSQTGQIHCVNRLH